MDFDQSLKNKTEKGAQLSSFNRGETPNEFSIPDAQRKLGKKGDSIDIKINNQQETDSEV